ncbi:hypothetical protein [Dyadobacter sandarakinus]|uniref:AlgX/AlgJ SGNH hydrolase-like domain-containing protein n=1 Tax=Dyadobacter sandarakinus TaxID=2747268 RepID=A0ABX7I7H5_9BACT|nr:hypothetical protein [Dyadobacter sandarakinus]QRR01678.1 hypothetical protein HWI92_12555 [Dyadobacter sandarakinus]
MKWLRYVILLAGVLVWAVGLSPFLISKAGEWGLIKDGYHYGDLYRLSNLSAFRDPKRKCPPLSTEKPALSSGKKIHLYIIGDSFTEKERVGPGDFAADAYTYVHWANFLHLKTDTSSINILLLESVERHFRQKLEKPFEVLIPDTATFVATAPPSKFMHRLDDALRSRHTEDRLDAFLFQNDLILGLKEWKADFNHHLFGRVNETVTLVNHAQDMVYYMDTDTPKVTSSFSAVRDTEIDTMMINLNKSVDYAQELGFDHVILAVIPNKVSVLAPDYGTYNNLINRVYHHSALKIPYINVLPEFRQMGRAAYLKGDSHWTCDAQYLWLGKVNALIRRLVTPAPHS